MSATPQESELPTPELPVAAAVPFSREAEASVIGAMLLDGNSIGDVVELLEPDDFYVKSLGLLYRTMIELFTQGIATDITIVGERLLQAGHLEHVGGVIELVRLIERVPSSANIQHHARIVLDRSLQRRLMTAASEILRDAQSGSQSIQELVDHAEHQIFEVAHRSVGRQVDEIGPMLRQTLRALEQAAEGHVDGVLTHYPDLDERLAGLKGGQMIILAARPSMGKTTLALNVAVRAATRQKPPTGVYIASLEMSRQQLAQNLLCCFANVDAHQLRHKKISSDDWARISEAAAHLSNAPIFIDDAPGMTALHIRAKARRLKATHGIGLVVVDYLQLIHPPKAENRQQEISQISMSLKQLAREIDVPVIAISQLNRSVDTREDHLPRMSDLRESGSLEQDADVVLLLYREDYYDRGQNPSTENRAKLIIAKQRSGPTGEVELTFLPSQLRFESFSNQDYRGQELR